MGWADNYITRLIEGDTVRFRPRGGSMRGLIESGDQVTIEPIGDYKVKRGDIVLCRVRGNQYLHLVKATQEGRYLIGNNRGGTNGWTTANKIYGVCTDVDLAPSDP